MHLESRTIGPRATKRDWIAFSLRGLILYCVVSMATLPFLDAFWLGELPVLAVVQGPKLWVAGWLRTDLVMPAIEVLGLSKGSFSPDYTLARPYALAIAYLVPTLSVVAAAWVRTKFVRPYRTWAFLLLLAVSLATCSPSRLRPGLGSRSTDAALSGRPHDQPMKPTGCGATVFMWRHF